MAFSCTAYLSEMNCINKRESIRLRKAWKKVTELCRAKSRNEKGALYEEEEVYYHEAKKQEKCAFCITCKNHDYLCWSCPVCVAGSCVTCAKVDVCEDCKGCRQCCCEKYQLGVFDPRCGNCRHYGTRCEKHDFGETPCSTCVERSKKDPTWTCPGYDPV